MYWVNLLFSSYRFLSKQKIIYDKEKIFPWCHNHLDIICCPAWSPLKLEPGSKSTLFSIDLTISDPRDQGWLYAGLISLTPGPEISHLPCGGLRSHYHSGGHWWHTGGDGWPGLCSGGDTGGMATAVSTAATVHCPVSAQHHLRHGPRPAQAESSGQSSRENQWKLGRPRHCYGGGCGEAGSALWSLSPLPFLCQGESSLLCSETYFPFLLLFSDWGCRLSEKHHQDIYPQTKSRYFITKYSEA